MASTTGGHQTDRGADPTERLSTRANTGWAPQDTVDDSDVCPRCGADVAGAVYCASCGLHLASALPELPTPADSQAGASSPPPAAARTPEVSKAADQPPARRHRVKFLIPIVALVAFVSLAVAVAGLLVNRPPNDAPLRSQVHQLQHQLYAADQRLASAQAAISAVKAGSQAGAVSNLQAQMHKVTICIPQVMSYVNGLNVNGSWVTDANGDQLMTNPLSVSSGVQISRDCSSLLYGTGP